MMQPMAVQVSVQKTTKLLLGTGVTQIVFGILLVITSALDMALSCNWYSGLAFVSSGIWSGVIIIAAGAIGVAVSKKKKVDKCLSDSYLGMSIVATLFSIAPMVCGIIGLVVFSIDGHYYCTHWGGYYGYYDYGSFVATMVLNAFLVTFGKAVFITSIVGAVYVCKLNQERKLSQRPMVIQTNNGPMVLVPGNLQTSMAYQPNYYVHQPNMQSMSPHVWQNQQMHSTTSVPAQPATTTAAQPTEGSAYDNQAFMSSSQLVYPMVQGVANAK